MREDLSRKKLPNNDRKHKGTKDTKKILVDDSLNAVFDQWHIRLLAAAPGLMVLSAVR